jgi:DNA-binding MarR family transcriptional regulator
MSVSETEGGSDAWGIFAKLWQLLQSVMDDSAPALEGMGLSPKAFFLLTSVEDVPFPAELARLMHLPPPTVSYLVKQLEGKEYLERRAEPGDLRKYRLVLTQRGKRAIRQGREAVGKVISARLVRIESEDLEMFNRIASTLAQGHD